MKVVNLYLKTNIKSIKPADGHYVFILELPREPDPAVTLTVPGEIKQETKNGAEILILEKALKRTKPCELNIFTDNNYLARALSEWLNEWQQNNFKDSKGEDIKYKDKWESIAGMLKQMPYKVNLNNKHSFSEWMEAELERRKNGNK